MNLFKLFKVLVWANMLYATNALSQNQVPYLVKHYNDETSLPQSSVNGLEMDANGFLWIATDRGMVRFDGQHFVTYSMGADSLMGEARVVGITKDSLGTIHTLGLTPKGVKISSGSKICHDANPYSFFRGIQHADGRFFLLYPNSVVDTNGNTGDWTRNGYTYPLQKNKFKGYCSIDDSMFYLEPDGAVVSMFSVLGKSRTFFYFNGDTAIYIGGNQAKLIIRGRVPVTNNLRVAGDLLFDHPDGIANAKIKLVQHGADIMLQYEDDIYTVYLIAGRLQTKLLYKGLTQAAITFFCQNPYNGGYFLGTATEALYYLRPNMFQTLSSSSNMVVPNAFYAIAPLPDNSIYTTMGIRFGYEGRADTIAPDYFGSGLHFDRLTNDLYHSNNKQIIKENYLTHKKVYIQAPFFLLKSMARYHDGDPMLWVAGERTLNYLRNDSLYVVVPEKTGIVYECIDFKNKGTMYLGTYTGLQEFDISNHKISFVPGLANIKIRSISRDNTGGAFWIGTEANGYYYLHEDTLVKMPVGDNGELNTTHIVLTDKYNNTWITCNNGLFMAPRQSLMDFVQGKTTTIDYHVFNVSDGLPTIEFNGIAHPAGGILPNGVLAFPGMRGIVLVDPDVIRPHTGQKIFMDSLWVDGKPIMFTDSLTLDAGFSSFGLSFSSPSWGSVADGRLKWNIRQLSGEWLDIPSGNKIDLFKLPAGEYDLVIKKGNMQNRHIDGLSFHFTVQPYWYQRTYAIISFIAIGLLLTGVFIAGYNKALIRKKNELEKVVIRRTKSLNQALADYQNSIVELNETNARLLTADSIKEQAISIILHDLKSPTFQLARSARLLAMGAPQFTKEELAADINLMAASAGEVSNLTESLLQWLLSQKNTFRPVWRSVSLAAFMEDVGKLYRELIKANGNRLSAVARDEVSLVTDPNILSLVIRNLLDNANKNTENSSIHIEGFIEKEIVTICIIDGGSGMADDKIAAINSGDVIHADGTGLGFSIIFQFLRILQGRLFVERNGNGGTTVRITLPMQPMVDVTPSGSPA
ncbi:MAG: ATP-binding protein [Chitinophagaceae bacterium]